MIHTASVNGFEMDYAVFGCGEKNFVIVPGLSLKSVMPSAPAVAAAYSCFAQNYTVYLFDVRKNLPENYTISNYADDLASVMETLGLIGTSVFGASMGGLVSLLLASKYPELVSRLAVSSTLCRSNEISLQTFSVWSRLAEAGNTSDLVAGIIDRIYSEDTLKKYRKSLLLMFRELSNEELHRYKILARALRDVDYTNNIARITCPVLALGAENDRVLGAQGTTEIAALLGCESYLYPEPYGHAIYDEAPDFKSRLLAFFDGKVKNT